MMYSDAEVNSIKNFTEVLKSPISRKALTNPSHFLSKYAPEFKKIMVDKYRAAEVLAEEVSIKKIKEIEVFEKEIKPTRQERKNVDTYGLSLQVREGEAIGQKTIANMNKEKLIKINKWRMRTGRKPLSELPKEKEIPSEIKLTEREKEIWDFKQKAYKETIDKINLVREMIGMKPLEAVENYDTLFRRFSVAERLGLQPLQMAQDKWDTPDYDIHPDDISFVHKKKRAESVRGVSLGDPLTGLKNYIRAANKYIYITPYQAKLRGMMETLTAKDGSQINLRQSNPYAHEFLSKTLDYIGGVLPEFQKKYEKLNGGE
jgi:hypothetical protein